MSWPLGPAPGSAPPLNITLSARPATSMRNVRPRSTYHGGTMRVRLYWLDGRVEEPKGEISSDTTVIVRQTDGGQRRFLFAEELDDEGFAIFWEEDPPS